MNIKKINLTLVIITVSFFLISAMSIEDEKNNKQVIKFDHALHAEAMECADCHTGVPENKELSRALLPEKADCESCHDVEDDENCTMCHYEDNFEALVYTPSTIIFDHSSHLEMNDGSCESCHIKTIDDELTVHNPAMANCASCHNDRSQASFECAACHKSTDNLVPQNHLTNDFTENHKMYMQNDDCAMCHNEAFCGSCHEASGLSFDGNISEALSVYSPHKYLNNGKEQKLARVHSLDFKMTHGIEARGKIDECTTCHTRETFCSECHSNNGGSEFGHMVPSSHFVSNFTTIGVGTGGGEHAIMAKRDIESCASCHDTQGADPNCILCHNDPDGIKGTNPRTHPSSFADMDGDWHDSEGSVCYNCHSDANANPNGTAGNGFCGYCHGNK